MPTKQQNQNQNRNGKRGQLKAHTQGKTVRAPVAQNRSSRQKGRNGQRYHECERILTVPGSVGFSVSSSIPLNPGLSSSFPWLSGHGQLFDKYRVRSLTYRYKNLKGTSTDGNILMSFDYDALDSAPSSALQMTQATRWVDGAPWRIFELKVPVDGRTLFTRSKTVIGSDLKTYDMGTLHIASEACADTSDHGYVEVEYDIELLDKSPLGAGTPAAKHTSMFNLSVNTASGVNVPVAFDEMIVNPLGVSVSSGTFTLPEGAFICTFEHQASVACAPEIFIDGVNISPLVTCNIGANLTGSYSAYVVSDGTTTVSSRNSAGTVTYTGDKNRAVFVLA